MTPARPLATPSMAVDGKPAAESGSGVRWYQGLRFKLLAILLLGAVALIVGAGWLIQRQTGSRLTDGTLALEQAHHRQLADLLSQIGDQSRSMALTLEMLQTDLHLPRASLRTVVPPLVNQLPEAGLIAAVGLWPEPANAEAERTSTYWVRDGHGTLVSREDYNDPRTIPYWHEAWYTPARYADAGQCYWTPVLAEALIKRPVVTCAMPMIGGHGFEGVATVSLDLAALGVRFAAATADERGYAVLLDRDGHAVALSAGAAKAFGDALAIGRNIAELAQKREGFGPLALALHRRSEAALAAALHAPHYDARSVSTLKDNTRELARVDAESALASLSTTAAAPAETLIQEQDPTLAEASYAILSELPATRWQIASVTPARDGAGLTRSLIKQTLTIVLAATGLLLLLSLAALQWLAVRPLRRITKQLAADRDTDPLDVMLDASSRDEIGTLAHWQNERTRQLRELNDRARVERTQLVTETTERQRAQGLLARSEERSVQTLANIGDGVIYTDERGQVESLNASAERLLGMTPQEAVGKPLSTVLPARLGGDHGAALPNIVETVTGRGSRLDYADGVFIGQGAATREVRLAVAPLTARTGRRTGCVVVFRPLDAGGSGMERMERPAPATTSTPGFDPVTGLGDRGNCERLLKTLSGAPHAIAVLDVVRLSDVNEAAGHNAGDEVLAQIGARLAAGLPDKDHVFRMPGDQLAMVLKATDLAAAVEVVGDLRDAIVTVPFMTAGGRFEIDVVIGVHFVEDEAAPPELLRRASSACRAARAGATQIEPWHRELDPAETTASVDDMVWVERIRAGLDRNLFHLTSQRIQPNLGNAAEGEVFEILLALEDEEGFWAQPAAFLPVAERHGLTAELDRWVISRTIETLEAQAAITARLAFIGVNLSSLALADGTLLDFLAERFSETSPGIVSKLCFELREADIDDHPQRGQRFCEAMRALGCRVSIDRYHGRRTSDVQLLRRLPAALIKLDSRPYRSIADDEVGQMQAESQLRVLHHLGKRVIVTGIDDERALAMWRKLGADYLQGYAVARPSPIVFAG